MAQFKIGGFLQKIAERISKQVATQRAIDPRVDVAPIVDMEIKKDINQMNALLAETDNPSLAMIYKDLLDELPKLARDLKSRK